MKLQNLQGKCTDIVCDNEREFDAVVALLKSNDWTLWEVGRNDTKEMVRLFSDGTYATHWAEFAGSVQDSTVITAKEFIEENS